MTSLTRLALGTAVLAGERLQLIDRPALRSLAVVVGLADQGRETAVRVLGSVAKRLPSPPKAVRRLVDEAGQRGWRTMASSRNEARSWLKTTTDESIQWAERSLIPRVIDDMTPKLLATVRQTIMPAVIEDLAADSRVRNMITEQSQGALTDATDELRETTATADDRVESTFRKVFHLR